MVEDLWYLDGFEYRARYLSAISYEAGDKSLRPPLGHSKIALFLEFLFIAIIDQIF